MYGKMREYIVCEMSDCAIVIIKFKDNLKAE